MRKVEGQLEHIFMTNTSPRITICLLGGEPDSVTSAVTVFTGGQITFAPVQKRDKYPQDKEELSGQVTVNDGVVSSHLCSVNGNGETPCRLLECDRLTSTTVSRGVFPLSFPVTVIFVGGTLVLCVR